MRLTQIVKFPDGSFRAVEIASLESGLASSWTSPPLADEASSLSVEVAIQEVVKKTSRSFDGGTANEELARRGLLK